MKKLLPLIIVILFMVTGCPMKGGIEPQDLETTLQTVDQNDVTEETTTPPPVPTETITPPSAYTSTIKIIGQGNVIDTYTDFSCGTDEVDCSHEYPAGESVELVENHGHGYIFTGWSGDCSGTKKCLLVIDGNKTVTATFTKSELVSDMHNLTVEVARHAGGKIIVDARGYTTIECTSSCTNDFPSGTDITIFAMPDSGLEFDGWSGDLDESASNPYGFLLEDDIKVQTSFLIKPREDLKPELNIPTR